MSDLEAQKRLEIKIERELGPEVNKALADPKVVEIMVNPDGNIWIERSGKITTVGKKTPSTCESVIRTIASYVGTTISPENPILECKLPLDGSRFTGILPPITSGPAFTIRKHSVQVFTLKNYVERNIISRKQADRLKRAISDRKNILVVGGTGTGKTTFCNAIICEISKIHKNHRIVIIEDTPEIQCKSENHVKMQTFYKTSMKDLVKATLRMRPDRIIIGEVRSGEALDLLKSWNTGHPGGIATVHANSVLAALSRIEDLIGEVTERPMQNLIAEAINIIIVIEKSNNSRKITGFSEVKGYFGGIYQLNNLLRGVRK